LYDESNSQVRQESRTYGLEGEPLTISGNAEPATCSYDALYRLKTIKDGNNNTTTYAYNNIGLPSSITMPGGQVTQFTSYDNDGNLLQRIDGNSVTTNYIYNDVESLLTDIQYPATTSLNVHFTYDSFGRSSGMTDSTGSKGYSYGNRDELLSLTTTYTGLAAKSISFSYYLNGSRESMTTPAGAFNYNYDAAGRPTSLTNPFSETTTWSYQNNDTLQTQTLNNGVTTAYTDNALGQITRVLNQIGATTISDFSSIAYDGAGNRTSVTAAISGATSLNGATGYTYDNTDQLTQEASTRNGGFTDNFAYDSAGNPTTFRGQTKTFNSNNQQTGTGWSYDGNGNPTTHGGTTLTFDPENRMTAYGAVLTAGYSGNGLRAWKQNSSGRTYFLYDGMVPMIELDNTGAVISTNTFGAHGLISRRTGSTSVFYAFDSEGNVSEKTDSNGSTVSDHLFNAFGGVVSGSQTDPFGYRAKFGYYTDNETGLQLLTYRYYDPSSGRFITRDPISYSGGMNLYSYVTNNPTGSSDSLGLCPEDEYKGPCPPSRKTIAGSSALKNGIKEAQDKAAERAKSKGWVEHGGWIIWKRGTRNTFTYLVKEPATLPQNAPFIDGPTRVWLHFPPEAPAGWEFVAIFHIHPDRGQGAFGADHDSADQEKVPGFVGDPSGAITNAGNFNRGIFGRNLPARCRK
jgi:RHS repeat-associated protein